MIVFPDTNVLTHFKPIESWDWSVLKNEEFQIGLCMSVIKELDKIKYSANSNTTKRRVQELVRKLSMSNDMIFKQIPFTIYLPQQLSLTLQEHHFDKEDKDDVFIASILCYQKANPDTAVRVISNDLGVQLKCKSYNIAFDIPPDDYLIQEDDAIAKEIKKLTQEVNKYKNLQPKLHLRFDNEETHIKFDMKEPPSEFESEIAEEMEKLKAENPFLEVDLPGNQRYSALNLFPKTPEKVEKYNKALEEYFEQFYVYLHQTKMASYKTRLTVELNIRIYNVGSTPAEDIDLYMHFPDGFTLSDKNDFYSKETEPVPPKLSEYQLAFPDLSMSFQPLRIRMPDITALNVGSFSIKRTNSYDVKDNFSKLKHGFSIGVTTLYASFDTFDDVKNFEIEYSISAANAVDFVEGKLRVVINKSAATPNYES